MASTPIYLTEEQAEWLRSHPEADAEKGNALRRWVKRQMQLAARMAEERGTIAAAEK